MPGRYSSGIGVPLRSLNQKMFWTHQRLPSKKSWKELMPRSNGSSSSAVRYD